MAFEGLLQLTDKQFADLSKIIYDSLGIYLAENKKVLVNTRIGSLLKKNNYHSIEEYFEVLTNDTTGQAIIELANYISTNHTFFNREAEHFKYFDEICLPQIESDCAKKANNDIRIWCCASSTGEEPIMLIIHMLEYFGRSYSKYTAGLLATDISKKALESCQKGLYHVSKFANMPEEKINLYFDQRDAEHYQVKSKILKEIQYSFFNLISEKYVFKKPFQIIFCRNVMIYFDKKTKEYVINKLYENLVPGGYLFVGHAESLNGLNHKLKVIKPSMYQK